MSASEIAKPHWLAPEFLERLRQLEQKHQKLQSEHDGARRRLETLSSREAEELAHAWRDYCNVIASLERTTAEFESLRAGEGCERSAGTLGKV